MPTYLPRMPGDEVDEDGNPILGFLASLGRTLDTPARWIREGVTGMPGASGRDVLEKIGILGPNTEGFDGGDIPGFLAEIAMDPLTYVGGIGAATKGAKLMKRGTDLGRRVKAAVGQARPASEIAEYTAAHANVLDKLAGRTAPIAKTWAEQGRMGDRAAFTFAGMPVQIPGVLPALEGTKNLLGRIPGVKPAGDLFSKLFNPNYGRNQELRPFVEAMEQAQREGGQKAAQATEDFTSILNPGKDFDAKAWTDAYGHLGKTDAASIIKGDALPIPGAEFATEGGRAAGYQFKDTMENIVGREMDAFARSDTNVLGPEVPNYFARYPTKEGQAALKSSPGTWAQTHGGNPVGLRAQLEDDWKMQSAHGASEIHRDPATAGMLTSEASAYQAQQHGIEGEFFDMDPARVMYKRISQGEGKIAVARFATSVVDNFAKYGPGHEAAQSVKDMVIRAPGERVGKFAASGNDIPASEFLTAMGLHMPEERLSAYAGKFVPRDIAEEAIKMQRKVTQPEEITKLGEIFDKVSGLHQFALTQPFPAFHVRNIMSDVTLSFIRGGAALSEMLKAWKLTFNPAWIEKMDSLGITKGSRSGELLKGLGIGEEPGRLAKASGKVDKYYTGVAERFTRTWHYLSMEKQGLTPLEAASRVRTDLLDYGNMTAFEKSYMKRAFFFYSWPRKVIPLLVDSYINHTGKMAAVTRATTMPSTPRPEGGLPEYLRQTSAIPAGVNEQGDPKFIANIGSPLEELNKLDLTSPEGGAMGAAKTLARKAAMQLNPLFKFPAELASNKEFFYDRPIIQGDKAPAALDLPGLRQIFGTETTTDAFGKTRYRADPYKLHALRNTPLARFVQTGSEIGNVLGDTDTRKSAGDSLLQILTGVRMPSLDAVDRARTEEAGLKASLVKLQREGKIGEIAIPFKTAAGKLDPDTVEKMDRLKAVKKLMKRMKEEAAAAPP